jgi:molybdenum cofactor synthesis domain-containing protein
VQVDVYARPTVAIVSTGNEIVAPGAPLGHGQIYDINRVTLSAAVERHGGVAMPLSSADDRLGDLAASLNRALGEDVVVFSGGSSVGERDLVKDLLRERGRVIFHGIAVKPGKPTAFASVDGKPVFGMPGYPTSCLSNAYMLLAPFLRKVARLQPWTPRTIDAPCRGASPPSPTGISSTRCGSRTGKPSPRSRRLETSPALRMRMGTSRSRQA